MTKKERKNQLTMVPPGHFAGAAYRDDSPRDFGLQIAYACWRWFQAVFRYPCPRQGSKVGSFSNDDGDGNENATKQ